MKKRLIELGQKYLSKAVRRRIVRYTCWPPVGLVRFGSLRRLKPISPDWGMERGQPIDRYYIEQFLAAQAGDMQGCVLEIGSNTYTRRFGGDRVTQSVVLHVAEQKEVVTLIGDLATGENMPADTFDCVILTQTLNAIFDVAAALRTVHRILKPGGVALITVPGISKICRYDMERWGYYWSFTTASMARLATAVFPPDCVYIAAHGNVLAAVAFLHGLASQELRREELDSVDPDYELLITVRAIKPVSG
ncbi:MAG: methyltransferase domain-containing protein [Anaerolinea sp.]|nr:methyltransferase domain-containing protein [Anaerolinea sp.]